MSGSSWKGNNLILLKNNQIYEKYAVIYDIMYFYFVSKFGCSFMNAEYKMKEQSITPIMNK
jgi:hypothetical protein